MFYRYILLIISVIFVADAINEKTISGKITHTGSSKLDTNYRIEISLEDISHMDAPSIPIASTIISNIRSFPISYVLKYKPSDVKSTNSYSISARITKPDGTLVFTNDVNIRVDFTHEQNSPIDIPVIEVKESVEFHRRKTTTLDRTQCKPFKCPGNKILSCPYGYQKQNGCEICRCHDPCNPNGKAILCGTNKRCLIDKKLDGTFTTRCGTISSNKHKQ